MYFDQEFHNKNNLRVDIWVGLPVIKWYLVKVEKLRRRGQGREEPRGRRVSWSYADKISFFPLSYFLMTLSSHSLIYLSRESKAGGVAGGWSYPEGK